MGSYTADQRRTLHKKGHALPPAQGSTVPRFPIKNATDVGDAINLARTPEERRFIYKRARQLGCLGKIPVTWKPDGSKTN